MIKDILKENEGKKPNSREMAVLKEHFGDCFNSDDTFDFEKFRAKLGEEVAISNEGYELNFLGKNYARLLTAVDTTTVVVPDEEHNSKPENAKSENVYISGDNLDALKHLLKSYARRVKCIYIDPPYNTGSDGFVYKDKFNFSAAEIAEKLNLDEEKAQRILDFSKRGSASHSAWLMFMYPRLQLARDLLSKDGFIIVAADDNELCNLKLLCDEVFREENFISSMIWSAGRKNDSTFISNSHEYMLFYFRDKEYMLEKELSWTTRKDGLDDIYAAYKRIVKRFPGDYGKMTEALGEWFASLDDTMAAKRHAHYRCIDKNGIYFPSDISWPGGGGPKYEVLHPITKRPCKVPERGWVYSTKERMEELIAADLIHFGPDENTVPCNKTYLKDNEQEVPYSVFYKDGRAATKRLKALLAEGVFQNPKDEEVLERIFAYATSVDSTIVDFFSGSGSTAHAVMLRNCLCDSHCKYVAVQIPEDLDARYAEATENEKKKLKKTIDFLDTVSRPHSLDYVGIERLIRAADELKVMYPAKAKNLDLGFKHYTLKEPTEAQIEKILTFDPNAALVGTNDILKEFGKPTVLATWLVRDGYGLTDSPKEVVLDGYTAYWKDKHLYFIDAGFTETGLVQLMEKYESDADFNPTNVVIFGYGGMPWSVRQGLETNLAKLNPNNNSIGAKKLPIVIDVRY